jgi:hypothetical protein
MPPYHANASEGTTAMHLFLSLPHRLSPFEDGHHTRRTLQPYSDPSQISYSMTGTSYAHAYSYNSSGKLDSTGLSSRRSLLERLLLGFRARANPTQFESAARWAAGFSRLFLSPRGRLANGRPPWRVQRAPLCRPSDQPLEKACKWDIL